MGEVGEADQLSAHPHCAKSSGSCCQHPWLCRRWYVFLSGLISVEGWVVSLAKFLCQNWLHLCFSLSNIFHHPFFSTTGSWQFVACDDFSGRNQSLSYLAYHLRRDCVFLNELRKDCVSWITSEKVRVMVLCGADLLESFTDSKVWIPDQVMVTGMD